MVEDALIGALLHNKKKIVQVSEIVSPEHFETENAKTAYIAILSLFKKNAPIDIASILSCTDGLARYFADVSGNTDPLGVLHYAKEVAKKAKIKRVDDRLKDVLENKDISEKLYHINDIYQKEMFVESKDPNISSAVDRFDDNVKGFKSSSRQLISTGFRFMDEAYIDMGRGHTWVMGAYTSVGKTAMMIQKVCNMILARRTPAITIISTEMTESQVIARIVGNLTGIYSKRVERGEFRHGEEEVVVSTKKNIKTLPIKIYDDVYELSDIETVFRKSKMQGGVDVGVIDYVQNCIVADAKSEYQEQSTMAKRVQKLAKEVDMCLLCLSQVSNDVARGNTNNFELKGAGEWAAVADVGIILYKHSDEKHKMKYSVKKNRHGRLIDYGFEYVNNWTSLAPMSEII